MTEKEKLSTEPYKGVRDFYPSDWARMSAMFNRIREVLTLWGYEEYNASPLEHSALYESKGNEEIINEQTYTFEDRGGRRVTLRPEMTPTLARMVSQKRRELTFPLRWFSIGNRFRYERPQKGRLREFYQTDVDLVGLPAGEADIEILTIVSKVLKAFGATEKDFTIRINSRALLSAACSASGYTDAEGVRAYWQLLDRKSKMSKEEFDAALKGAKNPLAEIETPSDGKVKEEKEKLHKLIDEAKTRGITNIQFDPEIVRGFDYYTGMVFEVSDTSPENPRSLFGGGRYDGLVALFGGDPIPAVGFAFGDVGLMNFLDTHNLFGNITSAPDLYIGVPDIAAQKSAVLFAERVRASGVKVIVHLGEKSLGDQIREASKRSIPYFIAYGSEEAKTKKVKVKHLESGKEKKISEKDVSKVVKQA